MIRMPIRFAYCTLVLGALGFVHVAPRAADAQTVRLPPGPLDSATVQSALQNIDYVFTENRPKAVELFDQVLARRSDIDSAQIIQVRYVRAVAIGDQPAILASYRELADLRGAQFLSPMPRVLLAAGEVTEALATARAWKPAAGQPARPWKEETESLAARLRGDARTALTAARAMRRYPGYARDDFAIGLEIAALALTVSPGTPAAAPLAALVDSALATLPRGYRVDPVPVFGNLGNSLQAAGHSALAQRAWRRALAVLDSTAPRAAMRGAIGPDSVRLTRGQLLVALGRYDEARSVLAAKSLRRDLREQSRQGWLGLAAVRMGDSTEARRLEAALAADTALALRSATARARAVIVEALGEPARAADLLLAAKNSIDLRTMLGLWMLPGATKDPRIMEWIRGR
jgi:tetratricopeptide (TPR) repeat protein